MSSFTPGPWGNCGGVVYAESDGFAVAKIANEHPEHANGNMRLIKAAPDLLEACELAKKRLDELGLDWLGPGPDPLEAAIAKARGA